MSFIITHMLSSLNFLSNTFVFKSRTYSSMNNRKHLLLLDLQFRKTRTDKENDPTLVLGLFWSSGIIITWMLFTLEIEFGLRAWGVSGVAFYYYWWTGSIKPRLLFSRRGCASWRLSISQLNLRIVFSNYKLQKMNSSEK